MATHAVLNVHGRQIDFGSTNTFVCVYGAPGNLRHNSDFVIAANDDNGTLIYSVRYRGRDQFSSPRKAECVAFCQRQGAEPGEFWDATLGSWRGWDAGDYSM